MGRHAEGKSPTISELKVHHRNMARLQVAMGLRPGELAAITGFSPSQISVITQSPLYEAEINRLESLAEAEIIDIRRELEARHPMALAAIDRGLGQEDDNKAAQIGFEILDRTGHSKGVPIQPHLHAHFHKAAKEMDEDELMNEIMDAVVETTHA